MFVTILNWISGGVIGQVGKQLNEAYSNKLQAKNNSERVAADVTIETLKAQREVLVAQGQYKLNQIIKTAFAIPFVAFLWKAIIWDNLLGLGVTDPLAPEVYQVMMVVLGGYFLTSAAQMVRGK